MSPLKRICLKLKDKNLDALLVSNSANIRYLTDYEARESYLLVSLKKSFFVTDFRYFYEAKKRVPDFSIKLIDGSLFKLIAKLAKELKISRLGFEAKDLIYAEQQKIREELDKKIDFVATYDFVEELRETKGLKEIKKIKMATRMAISAMHFAKKIVRPGLREIDLAFEIERFIRIEKKAGISFPLIVASGPNSSFPHHITSKRKLLKNDIVLIDLGVDFQGYKSDLTRVFFLGRIPSYVRKIYSIVLAAQNAAIREVRAGIPIKNIDKKARQLIIQKGYGRYFGHALGHGIGLEVHEAPHISEKNKERLKAGMVFTIEPAIYLPARFGIRIEDMVRVGENGCEVLSGGLDKSG
ncbi:MAG: aminopeptidase P family protein [Candidatus Omnitrophica bacterium]|nr:aminopeptidase P family protein [Candidatus Omnitrophota bacterium]